jgi:hypothetical protein
MSKSETRIALGIWLSSLYRATVNRPTTRSVILFRKPEQRAIRSTRANVRAFLAAGEG